MWLCLPYRPLEKEQKDAGIAAVFDGRDYKPGYKYFEWEQKGAPVRLELGPKDLEKNAVMMKDRVSTGKVSLSRTGLAAQLRDHLDGMQKGLLERAKKFRADNTVSVDTYDDFKAVFEGNNSKFVMAHWDGSAEVEARVKEETKATIRCVPYDSPDEPGTCIVSGKPSTRRVLFAKAY
jgi:prolyl-tRNA synthetase